MKLLVKSLVVFFVSLENRSKAKNIELKITQQDIWDQCVKQNHRCALSNTELTYRDGKKDCSGTASVDRIDSSKGYTKDNIQIVHKDVNYMKSYYDEIEFIKMCAKIVDYQRKLGKI